MFKKNLSCQAALEYSETCLMWPLLGEGKSDHIGQVGWLERWLEGRGHVLCCFSNWSHWAGGWIREVVTWAGLTVYYFHRETSGRNLCFVTNVRVIDHSCDISLLQYLMIHTRSRMMLITMCSPGCSAIFQSYIYSYFYTHTSWK